MDLQQLFWLIISPLMISFGQQIGVLFNSTIVLDNSTISWNSYNICQCAIVINETCYPQTTTENPIEVSTAVVVVQSTSSFTCANGLYGTDCDVSSAACDITNPCLNGGVCYSDSSLSAGYFCQCPSGYSGYDCEDDDRVCTGNTCWNNGTCTEINMTISGDIQTSYLCQCIYGYEGDNCQLEVDLCGNITCQYNGICVSSYLTWSCKCLDSSLYSGTYCQDKSSSLITKQMLSKSFAIVAIVALCSCAAFVVIMDILKYIFHIDPVDRERHRLQMEKEKKEQKSFRKKKKKKIKKKTKLIITRFSNILFQE